MLRLTARIFLDPVLWMRFMMESIVIVGSILFAFGIDAWWQEHLERDEELVALSALREEFASNLTRFRAAHDIHASAAEDVNGLLRKINSLPQDCWIEVTDTTLVSLTTFLTREAASGTLNTLLAGGKIDLIQNSELQQVLAEWPSVLEDAEEDEVTVRNFVVNRLIPGLAGYTDLSTFLARRNSQPLATGEAFEPGKTTQQLQVNSETRTIISERHFLSQLQLRSSERRVDVAESTLELLENQLAASKWQVRDTNKIIK